MAKHGRYKIGRKVADGGMAEIFLATQLGHEGFAKPVILKRIHSSIYADPQFRNMFIDEAHISMSLSHSNIVQVLDLGVGGGRYFLVLEFVDGWDLGRVLHRASASGLMLPRELGLHIAGEVCRALSYAHAKTAVDGDRPLGIVHRDVSPHNILLSEQGEVKLTDFGIAKAMNKREHTGTGVVKGKVAFMSPEQALGGAIDGRSDLFALGTVLYLLMARVRAFGGPTDLETLLRVQKADFRPPSQVAPDLPPEVAGIITRAMHLDPDQRYATADEMLADIEHVARSVYQPVGQSELKRWLAMLSASDGVPSIGKAATAPSAARGGTGSAELEGKDVVLSDSSHEFTDVDNEMIDGEEATSLAVVGPGGTTEKKRPTRTRPPHEELALPVPDDAESAQSGRHSRSEFSLPVPDDDGRPGRRRSRAGSGLSIIIFGVLLVAGAWVAGRYLGLRANDRSAGQAATTPHDEPPNPVATGAADAGAAAVAAVPADDEEKERAKEKEREKDRDKAQKQRAGEAAAEHGPSVAHRNHIGAPEHPAGEKHRTLDDLKDMMAPDPSQLPAPAPAPPAPKPADTPPPSTTQNP